jgi:hypothetical protein
LFIPIDQTKAGLKNIFASNFKNAILAGRAEFIEILDAHLLDRGFCADMGHCCESELSMLPRRQESTSKPIF